MKIKTEVFVTVSENPDPEDLIFEWELFSCALAKPPDRHDKPGAPVNGSNTDMLIVHAGVKKEGCITLDLTKAYEKLQDEDSGRNNGGALECDVFFKLGSDRGTLVVEAVHDGRVVGEANIEYAPPKAKAQQAAS